MTSNLPFARWGNVFGEIAIASAMIKHIVHHADVISLKDNSYRPKRYQPAATTAPEKHTRVALFSVGVNTPE